MLVECHLCEATVDGREIAGHTSRDRDDPADFHATFLECPKCRTTILGGRYEFDDPEPVARLWPSPPKYISREIPDVVRLSLEEARVCFKARAYSACTVMAGRALEGVCRHFGTAKTYLGPGIAELHKKGVIDARLARWAGALQKARNLSAHASGQRVSKQDAEDLLAFLDAICEYVFVLTKQFEDYMARRGESTKVPADSNTDLDVE